MRKMQAELSFNDSLFSLCGTEAGEFSQPLYQEPSMAGRRFFNVAAPKMVVECLECGCRFKSRDPQDCPKCGGSDLELA